MKRKIEILAPAGSWECIEAAVSAGADAVYTGGLQFGARAYAHNLDQDMLLRAIDYVHLHGRKIYLTVNTLLKEKELDELYDYLMPYYRQGLDAVIVQDAGAMQFIRRHFPGLPIHVSTQATVTNTLGAQFFAEHGAERIVPARELSLAEIRDMKEKTGLEIECFVHGAMCYCYSGQCLLSSMIGGRSGNRGQCAQPCRLPYSVQGSAPMDLLSLKDMSVIQMIPELAEAGIDSFKIEGRMKQPEYVYTVTRLYRTYTDLYLQAGKAGYSVSEEDRKTLENVYRRRGYIDGYYKRHNGKEMISFQRPDYEKEEDSEENVYRIKEKINGKLILSEGKPAKLHIEYKRNGQAVHAEVNGGTVQTAQKAPLDNERVRKQMLKTGNTEFAFETLDVEIEGNVFLPMQALNELRRDGIRVLEEQILMQSRRNCSKKNSRSTEITEEKELSVCSDRKAPEVQVSVQNQEQLAAALQIPEIDSIYVEGSIGDDGKILRLIEQYRRGETGQTGEGRRKNLYFSMPYIFRMDTIRDYEKRYETMQDLYDGVLIRNWESYEWLRSKNYPKKIVSDYNLYVFNTESKEFIRQTKIQEYTLSPELHAKELAGLAPGGILSVYGCQPVMITANCIRKTVKGCSKNPEILYLTDRCKKKFAVKNECRYCYNVIYNCVPLVLFDLTEEIKRLDLFGIRLDFTTETGEKTRKVMELCIKALAGEVIALPESGYTRGHFKRGVK